MRSTLFSTRFKFCIKVNKNSKSYFCQKLQQQGHSGVKRWTRKIDIFDVDRIVIPIHLGVHWTCAALLMEQKKVIYLDSMGGKNEDCRRTLLDYLRKEHKLRWVFLLKNCSNRCKLLLSEKEPNCQTGGLTHHCRMRFLNRTTGPIVACSAVLLPITLHLGMISPSSLTLAPSTCETIVDSCVIT